MSFELPKQKVLGKLCSKVKIKIPQRKFPVKNTKKKLTIESSKKSLLSLAAPLSAAPSPPSAEEEEEGEAPSDGWLSMRARTASKLGVMKPWRIWIKNN